MHAPFHLDLKVHRRKAGLSQDDVAHLIGVHPSKVSLLEGGRAFPTLRDVAALSVIFGRSAEEFVFTFVEEARKMIAARLPSMPAAPRRWVPQFNRQHTLDSLAERLAELEEGHGAP
jgi:transcriptional regulator with XRE-family HTH domain